MSGEAKQTLTNWLSRMATQDNQCLNSLLQAETCEINGNPANNANIDILNVDKIDYCHVEKWYDDETYQNMKRKKIPKRLNWRRTLPNLLLLRNSHLKSSN